jgi:hypothetical protein
MLKFETAKICHLWKIFWYHATNVSKWNFIRYYIDLNDELSVDKYAKDLEKVKHYKK